MAAVGGARAGVRFIDLDECSPTCLPSATDDAAAVEDESATLSQFGGGGTEASGARPDLILAGVPLVVVSGPPSAIASLGAQAFDDPGVSPYAFFETIIDIPLSVDARSGLSGAALFLFAPSLIGRVTLTDDFRTATSCSSPR